MVFHAATTISYNIYTLALAFRYMFTSFGHRFPWQSCYKDLYRNHLNTWNTDICWDLTDLKTSRDSDRINFTMETLSGYEFLHIEVKGNFSGIVEFNEINVVCLAATWVLVGLVVCVDTKRFGRLPFTVVMLTYAMALLIFVRGISLAGASQGLVKLMTPDWHRLAGHEVWVKAAVRIFYSWCLATGGVHDLSRYNNFKHNFIRSGFIVSMAL